VIKRSLRVVVAALLAVLSAACDYSGGGEPPTLDLSGIPTPTQSQERTLLDALTTAFGDEVFAGFNSAESQFGWKPLCSTDERLQNPFHGLVEVEPPSTSARLRFLYNQSSDHTPMVLIQQPDTYPMPEELTTPIVEQISGFEVRIWEAGERAGASFKTGETVDGHAIVATVFGKDFGIDRVREFISSLTFECS
jgi:hypothetical protein